MKHIVVKLLALIALACSLATTARAESFAKRVDIGVHQEGAKTFHRCAVLSTSQVHPLTLPLPWSSLAARERATHEENFHPLIRAQL